MHTEFEVKFLDVSHDTLRNTLRKAKAELLTPERLMRRRNLDFPGEPLAVNNSAWVRIRDEGDLTTISYKQTNDYTVTGTQEINLIVNDFDASTEFLQAIGMVQKSYQETKRESWRLQDVQIELDTWPWIPEFVELEGPDKASLEVVAQKLGLPWHQHSAGDASITYQKYYDITVDEIVHTELVFGPVPQWLQSRSLKANPS